MRTYRSTIFFLLALLTACGAFYPPKQPGQVETPAMNEPEPSSTIMAPIMVTATSLITSTLTPTEKFETISEELSSIKMFDANNGWGLTETDVVRTNDAGSTWVDRSPDMPEASYSIGTRYFLNNDFAWLLVPDTEEYFSRGTLYSTNDGGRNWTSVSTPFGGGSLTFLDKNHGWIMADLGAGAGSQAVAIYQTSDGGLTWKFISTNDPTREGADATLPLGGLKQDLVPIDMKNAFIGGVIYAPGTVYLFRSDNGGMTWQKASLILPEGMEEAGVIFKHLQFFDKTDGILALTLSSSDQKMILYATRDAGDHWTLLPEEFTPGGLVEFISPLDGVIYNDGSFWLTQDAGQTWSMIQPDKEFGESIADMDFLDKDIGWVIAYDEANTRVLFRTTNGGRSWVPAVK